MPWLYHWRVGERFLDGVEVVDLDEECDGVSVQLRCGTRHVVRYALSRLVHHLDGSLLGAREYELAIIARHAVRYFETETVDPEAETLLDIVDDENGRKRLENSTILR